MSDSEEGKQYRMLLKQQMPFIKDSNPNNRGDNHGKENDLDSPIKIDEAARACKERAQE